MKTENVKLTCKNPVCAYETCRRSYILTNSAYLLAGGALCVYFMRGVGYDNILRIYEYIEKSVFSTDILSLAGYGAIIPLLLVLSALSASFCPVFSLRIPLSCAAYGALGTGISYVLFSQNKALCAVYAAGFLMSALLAALMFAQSSISKHNDFVAERRITDMVSMRAIMTKIGDFSVIFAVSVAAVAIRAAAIRLFTVYFLSK